MTASDTRGRMPHRMSVVFPSTPNDEAMTTWTRRLLITLTTLAWLGFAVMVIGGAAPHRLAGNAHLPPEPSRYAASRGATLRRGANTAVGCTNLVEIFVTNAPPLVSGANEQERYPRARRCVKALPC